MATIKQFEDLICWQKARELTQQVYKVTRLQDFRVDRGLCDQIQRASVSIMSNIAEGFERGTKQEFLNYLFIAKGSAGEVRTQLYVALDAGYLNSETFKRLNYLVRQCSIVIAGLIKSLKVSEFKGSQYKKVPKPKTMSLVSQLAIEADPELRNYYNEITGQIGWGSYHEDQRKKNLKL